MKKWLVIHDLLAYNQHKDFIGKEVLKSGISEPKNKKFKDIQKGDEIVYYATRDSVIIGIFDVVSDIRYEKDFTGWGESMVYQIKAKRTPPNGVYLDFSKLLNSPQISFSFIPKKANWGIFLQGKTNIELTGDDFNIIESNLSNPEFLKTIGEKDIKTTKWHEKQNEKHKENDKGKKKKYNRHNEIIEKWKVKKEIEFGTFLTPTFKMNNVNLNDILPEEIWLEKNNKIIDGYVEVKMGNQPIYRGVLEVQDQGSKEDLCVRVAIILPFVNSVDIVSDDKSIIQIKELLERLVDPHMVKARIKFSIFEDYD